MNHRCESQDPSATPAVRQTAQSDLQYVSLQVDGKTYGGWYRLLGDGRMELLALSHVLCEHRSEVVPIEQAKRMLTDFLRTIHAEKERHDSVPAHATVAAADGAHAPATLGDLLYADRSRARVAESDWIALVHSIADGDGTALHRLFDRTQCLVFTLIFRCVGDPQLAEELTLDVFQDVWHRAARFEAANETVLAWLMNIARRKVRTWIEGESARNELQARVATDCDFTADFRHERVRFRRALAALAQEERQSIERAYFSQRTPIGSALQSTSQRIAHIHSGLTKLRRAVASGNGR